MKNSLLQKIEKLEKNLIEAEIKMISTLIKSGISHETATSTVKKIMSDNDYTAELSRLKKELDESLGDSE